MDTLLALERLAAKKTSAVENDDLETAVECKRQISAASSELYSEEEQRAWGNVVAAAAQDSSSRGTSLQESVELLESLDSVVGSRARLDFLNRPLASSDPLAEARFHLQARRTLRLLIALRTTHTGYDAIWPALLTSIQARLQGCMDGEVVRFGSLSPPTACVL